MQPIDVFLQNCLSGLRRISRDSRGDLSLEDVKGEAWVMAHDLALAGKPLDLTSPIDQDTFLGKLYGKLILSMRTAVGFARRLDKGWDQDHDEAGQQLDEILSASEAEEQPTELERRVRLEQACLHSYSQATAYAICLDHWGSVALLADYLGTTPRKLENVISYWQAWITFQPSIYDGVERISLDFMPLQRFTIAPLEIIALDGEQYGLRL